MTLEERRLRETIREMLKIVKTRSQFQKDINSFGNRVKMMKEGRIRSVIRNLILEVATEDPDIDPHANTGMNFLRKLFNNTSMLTTLRSTYKLMTTDPEQRRSFRAHIVAWVQDTLKTVKLNDQAGTPKQKAKLTEQRRRIQLGVGPGLGDLQPGEEFEARKGGYYVDVPGAYGSEKGEEEEELEPAERPELPGGEADPDSLRPEIPGDDTTGRDTAEQVYDEIEGSIIPYFARLDNPQDHDMFETWLIVNLKLYFDKWEKELQRVIEEPSNQEYEDAAAATPEPIPAAELPPLGGDLGMAPPPGLPFGGAGPMVPPMAALGAPAAAAEE